MATPASIPRFLLPRWPTYANGIIRLQPRSAILPPTKRTLRVPPKFAKPAPALEKPTKYNPPSHPTGPRPRKSAHQPLPQKPHKEERTHYPGMMPAPGTITYWILHSPKLHGLVAVSVLVSLAVYVMYRNFMEHDEAAQLAYWDWKHPVLSAKSFVAAYRESDRINTARIMEKRRQINEDMERKAHYRYVVENKVGGPDEGFGSWGVRKTQKDKDFGWGIVIDGKTIDEYIEDKERARREGNKLKGEGKVEEGSEVEKKAAEAVVMLEEQEPKDQGKETKKTWW
ncbi:hypothetical protein ABW19_dt0206889 [Dactylella cylindrospora]|nr:hypothetical protein ABW19_dt0206889 [Dactylella cylindrospora]